MGASDSIRAFNTNSTPSFSKPIVMMKKERIQYFEGIVISRKGHGATETFTVRKISSGVGVEKTFPIHSPNIASIEVVKKGVVRRAKLYFLRDREGQYKIKEGR